MKTSTLSVVLMLSVLLAVAPTSAVTTNVVVNSTITLAGTRGADGSLYQWHRDVAGIQDDVVHILGSQSPILTIKDAQPNDSATYTLYVTDPGITNSRPTDVFVVWVVNGYITNIAGTSLELAGPAGADASYQWLRDDVPLDPDFNPTVTNAMLQIAATSTSDSGLYVLRASFLTNGTNFIETEAIYRVTVFAMPTITDFSVTADPCGEIQFVVDATGEQLSYRWFREAQPISGETSSVLNLTCSAAPGDYYVVVTNIAGRAVSARLSLPVIPPPDITNFFVTNLCDKITFVVEATGCSLNYQWLWESQPLAGETNSVLNLTCSAAPGNYSVVVSSPCSQIRSQPLPLPFIPPPEITKFVLITTGNTVRFEVTATGCPLSYQWYWQGQPIPGATGSVLEYQNAYLTAPAGYYSVKITTPCGQTSSPPPGLLFTKTVPSANYEGILYDPNRVTVDSSGYFQMKISGKKRRFSGTATLGQRPLRFTGEFSDDHHSDVKLSDGTQMHLQLIATNDTATVTGTVDTGDSKLSLLGFQNYYTARNPFPAAGRYTLSLMDTNLHALNRLQPDGNGFAVLTVTPNGRVKMAGYLADGTPFSQTRGLSKDGAFPLYVSLYRGQGVVIGWLQFAGSSGSSIQGYPLYWIGYNTPYTFGNTSALEAQGSRFTPLSPGDLALPFNEGVATFTGGDLYTEDANGLTKIWVFSKVQYSASTRAFQQPGFGFHGSAPEKVSLKINPGNGQISGTFIDPINGQEALIKGVLLQEQGSALGYFLNENGSGYFALDSGQ